MQKEEKFLIIMIILLVIYLGVVYFIFFHQKNYGHEYNKKYLHILNEYQKFSPKNDEYIIMEKLSSSSGLTYFSNEKISKNIIMCGNEKLLSEPIKENIKQIKLQNPDWKFLFFNDREMDDFVVYKTSYDISKAYLSLKHGTSKADFFRYVAIHELGGCYLDLKSAPIKPLNEIINFDKDRMLLGQWGGRNSFFQPSKKEDLFNPQSYKINPTHSQYILSPIKRGEYMQWFVVASKGHPYLKNVISYITDMINTFLPDYYKNYQGDKKLSPWYGRLGVLCTTGPIAFTNAIYHSPKKLKYGTRFLGGLHDLNLLKGKFPFIYDKAYNGDGEKRYKDLKNKGHKSYYDLEEEEIIFTEI